MVHGTYISSSSIFGLGYFHERNFIALPLRHVRARVTIKEICAQVKLTQTFGNDAKTPIEAVYVFPVPARAAVSGFVMIKQDGTRVVGVVQEKAEAKATYDTAVAQGKTASLMGQETPDVFQVSVGNISVNEQVEIELTYSTELAEDEDNDSIRFHLPVHIGARYGQSPSTLKSTGTATIGSVWKRFSSSSFRNNKAPFIEFAISIEATSPISQVGCPSHTISTELGPDPALPNAKDLPFSNYARVNLTSESALDRDFVLTIKSAGLDAPRCIAELHPKHDTIGMALSFVPRFSLPDVKSQEFIFLVDRSGSMHGRRIAAASKALAIMLRSLPHMNTYFQIGSFGTSATLLWQRSRPYNQETLDDATRHVDGMEADYGGTEVRRALEMCFKHRRTDRPTSVFILTDGDAWDLNGVFQEVKDAVHAAPSKAYLRVYCLGIGNAASTAMCEGIARAGNGACMMVTEQESAITGKIARLLKAARTPLILDIKVDWGRPASETTPAKDAMDGDDDFDIVSVTSENTVVEETKKKSLNIFDESTDPTKVDSSPFPPPVVLPPPPAVQTSPATIQNLSPGIRLYVYAILKGKQVPQTVCLRGVTEDGSNIELSIPVTLSQLPILEDAPPALHALAARKIVQDFEDGRHDAMIRNGNEARFTKDLFLLKRTIKAHIVRLGKTYSIVSSHTSFVAVDEFGKKYAGPPPPRGQTASASTGGGSQIVARDVVVYGGSPPQQQLVPTKSAEGAMTFDYDEFDFDEGSQEEYSARGQISVKKVVKVERRVPAAGAKESQDPLERLARLQAFDGAFSLKALQVVKVDEKKAKAALPTGLQDEVVATIFAMAFIRKTMNSIKDADEKAPWEGIFDKAKMYIEASGHPVDDLIAKALKAL
ncbi:VIT-domain-containing protein [Hymenopellis radicata]|nr:VIT-domain-containing protein [Hymenopellis radicata]